MQAPSESIGKKFEEFQISKVEQRQPNDRDPRLPAPGTILTKNHNGKNIAVKVLDDGFECDGQYNKTLSAIAKKVTGKQWNGFAYFGLLLVASFRPPYASELIEHFSREARGDISSRRGGDRCQDRQQRLQEPSI